METNNWAKNQLNVKTKQSKEKICNKFQNQIQTKDWKQNCVLRVKQINQKKQFFCCLSVKNIIQLKFKHKSNPKTRKNM